MYLIQILAIGIWLVVSASALFNFKKTVLIWMMARLLINNQIAVRYNSPGMSAVIAVDITLILIYFFKYRAKKRKAGLRCEKFPLTGAFWVTLISFLLSSLFAIVTLSSGIVATLKYFISNFGIIFVFFKCLDTEDDVKQYVRAGLVVSVLITCLGIYELVLKDNPWLDFVYLNSPINETTKGRMWYEPPFVSSLGSLQMRLGMIRAYSTFGIHIQFGTACVFLLYLFMTIKKYNFGNYKKLYLNAVVLLLLSGVIACNSKTPIVGIIVLLFVFFGLRQIFQPKVVLPLIFVFVIIMVYFPSVVMNFMSLFNSDLAEEAGGSSVSMRQTQLKIVLDMFAMNPLVGNGMGSILALKGIGDNYLILGAESSIFQILPERGLLGLVAYIVTYLSLFKYGKIFMPFKLCFFYLASVLVMEVATGILDMAIWVSVYLCVIRMFQLKKCQC